MNITRQMHCIRIISNQHMFCPAFKQCSWSTLLFVNGLHISIKKPPDPIRNRPLTFLPQKKVIMVGHQTIRKNRNFILCKSSFHTSKKVKVIVLTIEYALFVAATIIEMIDAALFKRFLQVYDLSNENEMQPATKWTLVPALSAGAKMVEWDSTLPDVTLKPLRRFVQNEYRKI